MPTTMLSAILVRYKETSHDNDICTLIGSGNNFQWVSLQTVNKNKLNCLTKDKKIHVTWIVQNSQLSVRENDYLLCDQGQLLSGFKKCHPIARAPDE